MLKNRRIFTYFLGLALLISPIPAEALVEPFDHSLWSQFLEKFVNDDGEVNYAAVKEDPSLLETYLEQFETLDNRHLESWPREERLAIWLNVYHAAVIRTIVEYYPVRSIQDIPGVWENAAVDVAGIKYSLNEIRMEQILEVFGDEKIHLALSFGAKGSPRLLREPFTGPRVEGQLYMATREFVNDASRNDIVPGKRKVTISRIFKWYPQSFILDFGDPTKNAGNEIATREQAVLSFIAYYLEDIEKIAYLEKQKYKVKYATFEWELNDWQGGSVPLAAA